jgi:phytanoyl-CoA hydroxylase
VLLPGAESLDLTDAIEHFAAHGYARIGRALSDPGLAQLRERADDLMLGRVVHEGLFFQRDSETGRYEDRLLGKGYEGPSLNYRKMEKLEKDPLFFAWINNPLFERIARSWIAGEITIYRAVLFTKSASGGTVLPWHQDSGSFWGLSQDPTLQIWTALDDAPEEAGCVEVLPASHKDGLATPLGGVIPDNVLQARQADERKLALPAKAGEVLLLHNYIWHCSGLNRTNQPRRALSICYMSASTRCMRKRRAQRTFVAVF